MGFFRLPTRLPIFGYEPLGGFFVNSFHAQLFAVPLVFILKDRQSLQGRLIVAVTVQEDSCPVPCRLTYAKVHFDPFPQSIHWCCFMQ
jgi:hypothetical protein